MTNFDQPVFVWEGNPGTHARSVLEILIIIDPINFMGGCSSAGVTGGVFHKAMAGVGRVAIPDIL